MSCLPIVWAVFMGGGPKAASRAANYGEEASARLAARPEREDVGNVGAGLTLGLCTQGWHLPKSRAVLPASPSMAPFYKRRRLCAPHSTEVVLLCVP